MAPDVRRWVIIAALGSASIAIAYLPLEPREPRQEPINLSAARGWEARTARALSRATYLVRVADRREYLKQQVAGHANAPNGFTLVFKDPQLPGVAQTIRARLDSMARRIAPEGFQVPVIVVVDDGRAGAPMWLLPASAGKPCGVSATSWALQFTGRGELTRWTSVALSRCAYYAAFGQPGPAIREWLARRRYDLTRSLLWTDDSTVTKAQPPLSAGQDVAMRLVANIFYLGITQTNEFDEVACARGDLPRCRQLTLTAPREPRRPMPSDAGVFGETASEHSTGGFLAELVRTMGRDRFGRFWRSPLPVDSAFSAAFGADLGRWTADFHRRRLVVIPGATPVAPLTTFEGILAIAMLFGLTAVLVHRRQVA